MNLSSHLFWDVDESKTSFDGDASFIVPRVFQYGKWDDFVQIIRYYGREKTFSLKLATSIKKHSLFAVLYSNSKKKILDVTLSNRRAFVRVTKKNY